MGGILDFLTERLREPAECVIKMGASRSEIADLYPFLSEVQVSTSRADAATASLKFETRRDEHGQWVVQDAGVFAPWEPILIEAVFGTYSEEVFRGYVREVNAEYPADAGATTVTVQCQDDSLALDREQVRREWGAENPVSDADILREIVVGRHHLSLASDCGDGLSGLEVNQDDTDIKFLRARAEANGYELIFREGEVYFGPMRLELDSQATVMVYAGTASNCNNIAIKDDGHKPDSVIVELASTEGAETTQQTVEPNLPRLGPEPATGGSDLQNFSWRMDRQGGRNEAELAAQAQQRANDESMKVRAEGELDGSLYGHVLRVGEPVDVDGLGERYGGTWYTDSVDHVFDMQGYRQSFVLLRNAYGDTLEAADNPLANLM